MGRHVVLPCTPGKRHDQTRSALGMSPAPLLDGDDPISSEVFSPGESSGKFWEIPGGAGGRSGAAPEGSPKFSSCEAVPQGSGESGSPSRK